MCMYIGFKLFCCKVCDKFFSDLSNMKKYVKLYESEDIIYKCRYCGRNFVCYRGFFNYIKLKYVEYFFIVGIIWFERRE